MSMGEQPVPTGADSSAQGAQSVESRILEKFGLMEPQVPEEEPQEEAQPEAQAAEEPQGEEPEAEQSTEEAPSEDSALVDVEVDGKVLRVPPEAKDALLRQADYTRKTQELADQRRMLEAQQRALAEQRALDEQTKTERQHLAAIDQQLQAYRGLDWAQMSVEEMVRARATMDQLKDAKETLTQTLTEKSNEYRQKQAEALRALQAEGEKVLRAKIPNWGPERGKAIAETAIKAYGFTQEEMATVFDPRMVQVLHDAKQWQDLQASKAAVTKKVADAKPVVKPGARKTITPEQQQRMQLAKARQTVTSDEAKARIIQKELEMRFSKFG